MYNHINNSGMGQPCWGLLIRKRFGIDIIPSVRFMTWSQIFFCLISSHSLKYNPHINSQIIIIFQYFEDIIGISESGSVMSDSLQPQGLEPPRLLCPWNSPGQNTGVGSCSLLQGVFKTQGLNPCPPHHRQTLYHLTHQGSPSLLECVEYPFSGGSPLPRNRTGVSLIA